MRICIDTEFNEYRGALISMALVAEDGREWYGVRHCSDPGFWVREHVMPVLHLGPMPDDVLRSSLSSFLDAFDHCHIVADWTEDIEHLCRFMVFGPGLRIGPDRITFEVRRDLPSTASESYVPHNALEDARALMRGLLAVEPKG